MDFKELYGKAAAKGSELLGKHRGDKRVLYGGIGGLCLLFVAIAALCFSPFDKKEFYQGKWFCMLDDIPWNIYVNFEKNKLVGSILYDSESSDSGKEEKIFEDSFTIRETPDETVHLVFSGSGKPARLKKRGSDMLFDSRYVIGPDIDAPICRKKSSNPSDPF